MYAFVKRLGDIFAATVALLILSPLFIVIVILLSVTGEREVFYQQERVGFRNKLFGILKFATMVKNSPNMGTGSVTLRNDPRVTPIGKILRKTKINELPQILNVLLGQMSVVGPRPLMKVSVQAYPQHVQEIIYAVKPGITGIGSVVFRDEEKLVSESGIDPHVYMREVIMPYKGALELWYQQHISFWTDFKIIFLTAWAIVFPNSQLQYKWLKGLPAPPDFSRKPHN
jgi:lipopolysaccharide/colanic/teichoic acid biosynthesis glycosyltransferase